MFLIRFLANVLIVLGELALIAGAAWLGWQHPFIFAALTAFLAFALGLQLDFARLRHEYPFYFDVARPRFPFGLRVVAFGDSLVKGLIGGLVALLTFSGTDDDRRFWVAVVFAVAAFAGSSLLRRLSISFGAKPARWGFFRLAVPLGLVFSTGIAFVAAMGQIKMPTLFDIGRQLVFDMPKRPTVEQVSELLFNLKQYIDSVIAALLSNLMSADWAQVLSLVISVNVLTGFIVAIYALIIAEAVQWAERQVG